MKVRVDVVVYNSAISACGRAGQWEWAISLFKVLQDEALQCTVITYNSVISACEGRCWNAALQCFQELVFQQMEADAISYNSAITALAAAGQWQGAMHMPLVQKNFVN